MEVVDPGSFTQGGMFREKDFRDAIEQFNWSTLSGKPILIQGCSQVTLPTWAYLILVARLVPIAKSIHFGEVRRPIPIAGKLGGAAQSEAQTLPAES
jgi:hypothetical protein